jgi:hypothetical protein
MRTSAFPFVLLAVGLLVSPAGASAQAYGVTPTVGSEAQQEAGPRDPWARTDGSGRR